MRRGQWRCVVCTAVYYCRVPSVGPVATAVPAVVPAAAKTTEAKQSKPKVKKPKYDPDKEIFVMRDLKQLLESPNSRLDNIETHAELMKEYIKLGLELLEAKKESQLDEGRI